jgi:hypothetical protein
MDTPASNTTSAPLVSPVEASRHPGLEGRAANLVYRPLASVVLSPEYRRIPTWTLSASVPSTANIFTSSAGYRF